jgi:extracellular matrix protein 14
MRTVITVLVCLLVAVNAAPKSSIEWDRFWNFYDIFNYFNELAITYPQLVFSETIGFSYEQREIKVLKISSTTAQNGTIGTKPIIFIEGGSNGRDQISPMVALNFAHELVEHAQEFEDILNKIEFVILPISNPDGFEFAYNYDRSWIKTRRPTQIPGCYGININRNFPHYWAAGEYPCSDEYSGAEPLSEAEAQSISDLLRDSFGTRIKLYLNLQTPGTQILYPYAHTDESPADNYEQLLEVGQVLQNAIRESSGTEYYVGPYANTMGLAAGTSIDYANSDVLIPLSLTWNIRGDANGGYQHAVSDIDPIVDETFAGILALSRYIADNFE